ncbi:MAG: hypothetical protein M3115_05805 [Thermoproteota archaeon]|nr:hypothetical protein [Thermoproteota archaeon]
MPPSWIRVRGNRAFISGQDLKIQMAQLQVRLARLAAAMAMMSHQNKPIKLHASILRLSWGLKRELGDLDGVTAWLMVNRFVNVASGFTQTTAVVNGCSETILELYGREVGQ